MYLYQDKILVYGNGKKEPLGTKPFTPQHTSEWEQESGVINYVQVIFSRWPDVPIAREHVFYVN